MNQEQGVNHQFEVNFDENQPGMVEVKFLQEDTKNILKELLLGMVKVKHPNVKIEEVENTITLSDEPDSELLKVVLQFVYVVYNFNIAIQKAVTMNIDELLEFTKTIVGN